MNKSLYFIECTANDDVVFNNGCTKTIYKKGDVVYFNPNAASKETYVGYGPDKNPYRYWSSVHLPFTRQKRYAKKWQIKEYANKNARLVNSVGQFTAVVKEIKLTYTETEV